MPKKNIPSYRLHKPTSQAIVSLRGKMFYLGQYKSQASWERYNELIAEYLTNDCKLPPTRSRNEISIEELVIRFLEYAEGYYVKNGKPTDTFTHCRLALSPLVRHYGSNPVSDFGPLSLVFVRDKWVEAGTARETINRWVNIVRQAFRWGVAHELVAADILHALEAVDSLKAGRTTAPEYQEIESVSDEILEKTLPHLPPTVADMVRVQRLAGLRPQDIRNMRACDIDRTGGVWKFKPFTHKTEHHGKQRILPIGPRVQAILLPYLIDKQDSPDAFLFSPADSEAARKLEMRESRKTPVQPSQRKRETPPRPDRRASTL